MSVEQNPPPTSAPGDSSRRGVMERPHPLTPVIRGWIALVAIAIFFFREFIPDGDSGDDVSWLGPRLIIIGIAAIVVLAAVAGFVTWYWTHFVIDDTELRIETGALYKRSRKIPFERLQSVDIIQPLAARIFGLAELRLEVGAGDSTVKLRYLTRTQADRLRNYLLTRAAGEEARIDDDQTPGSGVLTDLNDVDQKLVVVSPQRLIASFVLSVEWLSSILVLIVLLIGFGVFGRITYALPILIPTAIGAVTLISNRLINMFNFTLAESPRGFRIVRGLTSLTSQSVPVNRIQGVRVSQSILWRRHGWYRVDVTVLGVKSGDSEDNERSATSVLLPVADREQVALVLARILPGLDLSAVELHPASPRVKKLRWFDYPTLKYGFDEHVMITDFGWVTNVRDVTPHAKVQSVRIEQGPLQRRLDVAHVHFDLVNGPVKPIARHVPVAAARELALTELDRARTARALVTTAAVPDANARTAARTESDPTPVLRAFGVDPSAELGRGGEAVVYGLDAERVLRVYRSAGPDSELMTSQLRALYDGFAGVQLGFALPRVLDAGWIEGQWSSVDRRLPGRSFSTWLAQHGEPDRHRALLGYLDATLALRRLPSPVPGFVRLVGAGAPERFNSFSELLTNQMSGMLEHSFSRLEADLPAVDGVWDRLQDELADLDDSPIRPTLVHGDVCPANVLVDERGRVTALTDFSPHTLSADPLLDVVGAVAFVELEPYAGAEDDAAWLTQRALERLGPDLERRLGTYKRFYAFYYSVTFDHDPRTYAWCLRQLGG